MRIQLTIDSVRSQRISRLTQNITPRLVHPPFFLDHDRALHLGVLLHDARVSGVLVLHRAEECEKRSIPDQVLGFRV